MKRNLLFFAAALVLAVGCNKEPDPTVEFAKVHYVIPESGTITVDVRASEAPKSDLVLPIGFVGDAVLGEDYQVDAETVLIRAGETTGSIVLTLNDSFDPEMSIVLILTEIHGGYVPGNNITAVITSDAAEKLVYSFEQAEANLMESFTIKVKLVGTTSGKDYKAAYDFEIPIEINYGKNSKDVCSIEKQSLLVEKGNDYGSAKIYAGKIAKSNGPIEISLAEEGNSRFIAGDNPTISLNVTGPLKISDILGEWKFSQVYDLEEMELWFMEYEDDPDLLPTHNDGFTLTFSEKRGVFTVTPSGTGDFANFFRECTLAYCEPMNITRGNSQIDGSCTTTESNMYIAEAGDEYQQLTYFRLSKANRAFSSKSETIGESTIAMRINSEGNLEIQLRDYDTPPFGEMWWDDSSFDPDMFGFASEFVR